jgi:uncharacterized surface protein with fasciclin (FAS1) repeats
MALVVVSTCLVAALTGGLAVLDSKPRAVEVKKELPIREALRSFAEPVGSPPYQHQSSSEIATGMLFEEEDPGVSSTPDADVVDTASKFDKFSMLVSAAKSTGLIEELRSADNVTIFAPTNRAFAQLPEPVFEQLMRPENRVALRKLISDHIVPEKVVWSDLFGRKTKLTSISGSILIADGANGVRVNGVQLRVSDVLATNGTIHAVDRLIIPVSEKPSVM